MRSSLFSKTSIGPMDILNAAQRYAPGGRLSTPVAFVQRMLGSVQMITLLSLFAAFVFDILGLRQASKQPADSSNGNLDIAKVFAGVVVGSASTTMRTSESNRS